MTYKIVFFDIDGTILKPDHSYEPSTKEAIKLLQAKGIQVALATGRPLHELESFAQELNVNLLIGYNGAYARYNDEIILKRTIDRSIVQNMLQISKRYDDEIVVYTDEENLFSDLTSDRTKMFIDTFLLQKNGQHHQAMVDHIFGMTLVDVGENKKHYFVDDSIQLTPVNIPGVESSFDVVMKEINKGVAITHVLKHLGIEKEHAIAFGDGMNDKEMMQSVGVGVAMGNAHPDLFQYAAKRTTSVSDSGIFNGLKKLQVI